MSPMPDDPRLDPPMEREPVVCACGGVGCDDCLGEGDMSPEEFERRLREDDAARRLDERLGK